jgi:hypothetical protein
MISSFHLDNRPGNLAVFRAGSPTIALVFIFSNGDDHF